MSPPPPRLVAIWVPDWPVVALTLEARAQRRSSASAASTVPAADPAQSLPTMTKSS